MSKAPRQSESTIFGVPGGPKKGPTWLRNQLPAATRLRERLGGLWGSILGHFGVHFELPNRSKNDTENKLILNVFLGPLEIRGSEILMVILTWFGPVGVTKKAIDSIFCEHESIVNIRVLE